MTLEIKPLTDDLLDEADRILMAAFRSPSRKAELVLYRALQPNSWLMAEVDGAPVGLGGVTSYGPFAYLGLMAVDPAMQRRGIGRALVEALVIRARELGGAMVLLDASAAGAPVYERVGFVEDDRVRVYICEAQNSQRDANRTATQEVTPLTQDDLPALVAFDAGYFGVPREAVLAMCLRLSADRALLTRDTTGAINGYLIAFEGRIGPWIAATPEAAEALLAQALKLPFSTTPSVFVPAQNRDATELLERSGFGSSRELRHMRYGGEPALQRRERIYGQASFAIG
jgi:GNAT superfamily N-acetyltransferase